MGSCSESHDNLHSKDPKAPQILTQQHQQHETEIIWCERWQLDSCFSHPACQTLSKWFRMDGTFQTSKRRPAILTCHQSSSDVARIISESKLHLITHRGWIYGTFSWQFHAAISCGVVQTAVCDVPTLLVSSVAGRKAEAVWPQGRISGSKARAKLRRASDAPSRRQGQSMPVHASPCQSKIQGSL